MNTKSTVIVIHIITPGVDPIWRFWIKFELCLWQLDLFISIQPSDDHIYNLNPLLKIILCHSCKHCCLLIYSWSLFALCRNGTIIKTACPRTLIQLTSMNHEVFTKLRSSHSLSLVTLLLVVNNHVTEISKMSKLFISYVRHNDIPCVRHNLFEKACH
jgi:hypothetical protein